MPGPCSSPRANVGKHVVVGKTALKRAGLKSGEIDGLHRDLKKEEAK